MAIGPKISHVKSELLRQIAIGNFARGATLPPERDLAKLFNVSYMTIRRAMDLLVEEGIVERIQGSGTFLRRDIPSGQVQKTVGMVLAAWESPDHTDMATIFSEIATQCGVLIKIYRCRHWSDKTIVDAYTNSDALIIQALAADMELPEYVRKLLASREKPVVIFGHDFTPLGLDSVMADSATLCALEYLQRLGHRHIGLLSQINYQHGAIVRYSRKSCYDVWYQYLKDQGFADSAVNEMEIRIEAENFTLPHRVIYPHLSNKNCKLPFTALIIPLSSAWGVYSALYDRGLAIPGEISLMFSGDRQEAEYYRPRFTTVCHCYRKQAEAVMSVIQNWQPTDPPQAYNVTPEIIPGETVRDLNQTDHKTI